MMKLVCNLLGLALLVTAIGGFCCHDWMGACLSPMHDAFLLLVGVIALYFGITGTEFQARYTCRAVGVLFTLLGAVTFLGGPGHATAGNVNLISSHVLKIIPHHLEYTTVDGVRDLVMGIVGLIVGFFPREQEIILDDKAAEARKKVLASK